MSYRMVAITYAFGVITEAAKNEEKIPVPGWFHCWAGTSENAYALIELESGRVVRVEQDGFYFLAPPLTKTDANIQFEASGT